MRPDNHLQGRQELCFILIIIFFHIHIICLTFGNMNHLVSICDPNISIKLRRFVEFTCIQISCLCPCSCRLMKCFMLEELILGMLNKESIGLSCQIFPAVDKLLEFSVSKDGVWTKISWSFMLVQFDCQNHQLCGEGEMLLWIWNDSPLVHGNFGCWISHVISIGVQLQSNFIAIIIKLLLAKVSPHSATLSDQLVEMLSVERKHSFC